VEPLDTDMEYMIREREPRPASSGSRFSALLIFPVLGFLLLLTFFGAAAFQWNVSDLVDSLMGLLMVLFVVFLAMLFWAMAPRVHNT
jgi:fumarate reductase subunit D